MPDYAVIFDMDGVLVNSNAYHKKAWTHFFKKHDLEVSEEDYRMHVFGHVNPEILRHFFGRISSAKIKEYIDEKESLYSDLIEPEITYPEGLIGFLDLLKKNKIVCAVATSAPPENVEFTLDKIGIRKYFRIILDDRDVSKGKPDPEIYLKTAMLIEYPPEKCIVIEDSVSGIKAGINAGMKVIAITTTHTKEELSEADLIINDFLGLPIIKLEELVKQ